MALTRRSVQRVPSNIWPGFVDAMTGILLVLIFVLTIFMIVQFVLRETISGQESELDELSAEINALAQTLGFERQRADELEDAVGSLRSRLDAARANEQAQSALIAALQAEASAAQDELAAQSARISSFEEQVASLLAQRDEARAAESALAADLDELRGENAELISQQEALRLALARVRTEVDEQEEAARLAAARREALDALIADLRGKVADQETQLANAEARISEAEAVRLADAAAAEALRKRLENAGAELTAMTLALEEKRREAEETLTLLAAAEAAKKDLDSQLAAALSEEQRQAQLLALANERLREEEAKSADSLRDVAALNLQLADLRSQLVELQALLDGAIAAEEASQVELHLLGSRLNAALAQVAAEQKKLAELEAERRLEAEQEVKQLEAYRSEFFGKLRSVLAGRQGVRIVGDRFVFSSEVLFEVGDADLSVEGQEQVEQVALILRDVADEIPSEIDWVVRVDGHTDDQPFSSFEGKYADNWELSQGRALSVVRYMIDRLGFPPDRLAATGFGEYQPVVPGGAPEARAQNRRIELKLTEK